MADSGAGGSLARKLAEVVLGSAHPPSRDEHSDDTEVAINSLRAAAEQRQTKRLGRSSNDRVLLPSTIQSGVWTCSGC